MKTSICCNNINTRQNILYFITLNFKYLALERPCLSFDDNHIKKFNQLFISKHNLRKTVLKVILRHMKAMVGYLIINEKFRRYKLCKKVKSLTFEFNS